MNNCRWYGLCPESYRKMEYSGMSTNWWFQSVYSVITIVNSSFDIGIPLVGCIFALYLGVVLYRSGEDSALAFCNHSRFLALDSLVLEAFHWIETPFPEHFVILVPAIAVSRKHLFACENCIGTSHEARHLLLFGQVYTTCCETNNSGREDDTGGSNGPK